jgi:hypothetical protein
MTCRTRVAVVLGSAGVLLSGCGKTEGQARAQGALPTPRAAPAPSAGPAWRGDHCSATAQCGWDDPCAPKRCQKVAGPPKSRECGESLPSPGECLCVDSMCTLKPKDPKVGESKTAGCATDADCAVDVPTATCHVKGTTLIGPIRREGPVCTCDAKSRKCQFQWSGPVPCKSFKECSYSRYPRLRPIPAKPLRRRPVRPCRDGEVDSVCRSGFCEVVSWSC